MLSRGGFEARMVRSWLPGTGEGIDALITRSHANPDKAFVMTCIGQLVADGFASWDLLENGEVEVRFNSGETFLLGETAILRLA